MYIEPEKINSSITDEDMDAYKKCVLNILIDFDTFLKSKGIKYSLEGGTLLGAIRHNGFIPWDDDIDIGLNRKEFLKLLDVIDEFKSDVYDVYLPLEDSPLAIARMIKIYDKRTCIKEYGDRCYAGAFIDVFSRIDVKDESHKEKESNFYRLLTSILSFKNDRNEKGIYKTKSGKIVLLLSKIVPKKWLKKKIESFYSADYDGNLCFSSFGSNKYFRKEIFEKYTEHVFEGHMFPIIEDYDEYLTTVYGDYMKLPPEDERNPHHLEYLKFDENFNEKNKELSYEDNYI